MSTHMDVWQRRLGALAGPSAPLGIIFNRVSDLAYRITSGDERFALAPKAVVSRLPSSDDGCCVAPHGKCLPAFPGSHPDPA